MRRYETLLEQETAGLVTEAVDIQYRTMAERTRRPDGMQAPDHAPHPQPVIPQDQFRPATALARIERVAIAMPGLQRRVVVQQRSDHRNFLFRQFQRQGVLLQDRLAGPASGPVELRDDRRAFVEADLINAVFVAVEREKPAAGTPAALLDGIEQGVGCQAGVIDRRRIGWGVHVKDCSAE